MTAKVPDDQKRRQIVVHAVPELVERIERFRRSQGSVSRSAALCILIETGLRQAGLPPTEE